MALLVLACLAACGGVGGSDEATPRVTAEPPAAGNAIKVHVAVVGATATPIEGVVATVVGSAAGAASAAAVTMAASAVTGVDGKASFELPSRATLLVKLSKTGYVDAFKRVGFGARASATLVNATLRTRDAGQPLDAAAGGRLQGRDGAVVELPAGALVDARTGAAVTGTVDIAMTPIDVSGDEFRSFPGTFAGVDTNGTRQLIASYGTTEFMLTQNGRRLNLAPGTVATIELPIYTPLHEANRPVATGDAIPLWSLDETTGDWKQEGSGTVVASASSPTGLAMRASVGHFSWWNCDIAIDTTRVDLDIEMPDVPDADRVPDPRPTPNQDDIGTDPNRYREGIDKLVHIDARTADDKLLRQAGQDFAAVFDERNYKPGVATRTSTKGDVYRVAQNLIIPAGRPVAMTACAEVKRGGPTFSLVSACGTVLVTQAVGVTSKVTIKLQLGSAQAVPIIIGQPRSLTVEPGQTAAFTVTARSGSRNDDAGVTYQWRRNGAPIEGATAATYTVASAALADSGNLYSVVVQSIVGVSLSVPARLQVEVPPPPPPPPPPPNSGTDRWVDAALGNDANPGTEALPYQRISKAYTVVQRGGTIWLKDGTWTPAIDPALAASSGGGLNCRAPVAGTKLRAVRAGAATIQTNSVAICLIESEVHGIRLQTAAGATDRDSARARADVPGLSLLSGVILDGGSVTASGGAHVTIVPAGLASYGRGNAGLGATVFATGAGTLVRVQGGAFDALGSTHSVVELFPFCLRASIAAYSGGSVVLDGVAVRRAPEVVGDLPAAALAICNNGNIDLRGNTLIEGFLNGVGAQVGQGVLTMADAAAIRGNGTGIVFLPEGSGVGRNQLVMSGSAVIENSVGSGVTAVYQNSLVSLSTMTLGAGTAIRNNGAHGLYFPIGTAVDLAMEGAAVSGNGLSGVTFIAGSSCRLRNSRVTGNATYGIRLGTVNGQGSTCDLGSAAGPGGNVFDNGGTSVFMEHFGMRVSAVGNTWTALQQGADAQGRYVVPAGQSTVTITGPRAAGRNFGIVVNGSTLLLAE